MPWTGRSRTRRHRPPPDRVRSVDVRITHVGGPTVLLEVCGWRVLTDPTFDPPGRRYSFGWGTSSTKLVGPALSVDDLGRIDVVLLSHDHHADNLDDAGRQLLKLVSTVVTTRAGAARLGGGALGLDPWESTRLKSAGRPSLSVTATPCRHGPPLSRPIVGDVIGFAVQLDDVQDDALWISGDTVLFDGVRAVPDRFHISTALLHLGSVKFPLTGPLHYSMTGDEAVAMCALLDTAIVIPVHYEGWTHFQQGRADVEEAIVRAASSVTRRVHWLPIGQAFQTSEPRG